MTNLQFQTPITFAIYPENLETNQRNILIVIPKLDDDIVSIHPSYSQETVAS